MTSLRTDRDNGSAFRVMLRENCGGDDHAFAEVEQIHRDRPIIPADMHVILSDSVRRYALNKYARHNFSPPKDWEGWAKGEPTVNCLSDGSGGAS